MKRLNQEKDEETSGQRHLREKIWDLEGDLEKTVKEKRDVEYEVNRIKSQKDNFDNQYDDLKRETLKVRSEFETTA